MATAGSDSSSTTDYEQRTYDPATGDITGIRLRDTTTMSLGYDKLHRLTSRTPSGEATVNIGYNLLGMRTSYQRPSDGVTITNSYDALGRLTGETQAFGSVTYQYDAAGNRTRLTWSDSNYILYDYDAASRVTKIRENGASSGVGVLATYAYDTLGRRSTVTYGNGTVRTYAWDTVNRLAGLKIDLAGTTNDLVIGKVGSTGTAIGYNPASQIASIVRDKDVYAYTDRMNVSRSYTTNGLNQYTAAGGVSFTYDTRGNLTTSGSNSYTYSRLNELKTGPGVSLYYDPLGRLHEYNASTSTRMVYAGDTLVAEVANPGGAVLRRYVPGPGTDEIVVWYEGASLSTPTRRFLQADERGSIIAVSDNSGGLVGINRYDEYGIPAASNIGRMQYTGQVWLNELGMYNYKARIYSPTLGRFMQTDPIGYADGLNWYNYVGSDPVNKTDPSGLYLAPNGDIVVEGVPFIPWWYWAIELPTFSNIPSFDLGDVAHAIDQVSESKLPQSGHDYSVYGTVCDRPLNNAEMSDILSRFSLPGHSGEVATDGNYTVYQWGLPGGRVNVDFADNGLSVRNTTLNPHIFAGQIDRHIYSDRFGTFITTRGTGTAEFLGGARDWLNEQLGPGIFEGLNEDAAAYAKKKFSGF